MLDSATSRLHQPARFLTAEVSRRQRLFNGLSPCGSMLQAIPPCCLKRASIPAPSCCNSNIRVRPEQTSVDLFHELFVAGAPLVVETLTGLSPMAPSKPQPQDHSQATLAAASSTAKMAAWTSPPTLRSNFGIAGAAFSPGPAPSPRWKGRSSSSTSCNLGADT